MSGWTEGSPRDVEPAIAGEELVGQGVGLEECNEALELGWFLGADVGSTALKVLGVADTTDTAVDVGIAEAGVDDDGAADGLAGGLQQLAATVSHVGYLLDGGDVLGVLLPVAELAQAEVLRELDVIDCVFH